jgi:hypothetical protein
MNILLIILGDCAKIGTAPVKGVDVGSPAQQALPEDGQEYDADAGHAPVHRLQG